MCQAEGREDVEKRKHGETQVVLVWPVCGLREWEWRGKRGWHQRQRNQFASSGEVQARNNNVPALRRAAGRSGRRRVVREGIRERTKWFGGQWVWEGGGSRHR